MSSQDPDDDFPQPGDGSTTIRRMIGTRLTDGPILGSLMPAHILGEVIVRLGKLYSALADGGQNLSRSVAAHPFALEAPAAGSIRLAFSDAITRIQAYDENDFDGSEANMGEPEAILSQIAVLVRSDPIELPTRALDMGTAVASAYRALAEVLGENDIVAEFELVVDDDGDRTHQSRGLLEPLNARSHADALANASVTRTWNVRLVGVIDELARNRGTFKLDAPKGPSMLEQWRLELNSQHRSLRGTLTPEAISDARRLNVWGKLVTVDLEITETTAPTSTVSKTLEGTLLRVVHVHEPLPFGGTDSQT